MPTISHAPLALLAFGLVALIGLIVLTGTGTLHDDTVKTLLISTAASCVTAAAGLATPNHTHDEPTGPPLSTEDRSFAGHRHGSPARRSSTSASVYVPPGA